MELSIYLPEIAAQYHLRPDGPHGLSHWARVLENGLRLAELCGGDRQVIELFTIFHDACRINDQSDPGHGRRGARLARSLIEDTDIITPQQLELLESACRGHTSGKTTGPLTVQICWDADRLDLARVGIQPDPDYLCTASAKQTALISWASYRARNNLIPEIVPNDWQYYFQI